VVATYKSVGDRKRLQKAYSQLGQSQLRAALTYYDLYLEEIDARLRCEADWSPERLEQTHPVIAAEDPAKYRRKSR
jgi:hypothetical protein